MTSKPRYMSKTVQFGGKKLTLFSLDGLTWSSRKDELLVIKERHEAEKVTAAQLRGELPEGGAATAEGATTTDSDAAKTPTPAPKRKLRIASNKPVEQGDYSHPAEELMKRKREEAEASKKSTKAQPVKAAKKQTASVKKIASPKKRESFKAPAKRAKSAPKRRAVA